MKKLGFLASLIFFLAAFTFGQGSLESLAASKGEVCLKFSGKLLGFGKVSAWSGKQKFKVTVSRESSGNLLVNGDGAWKSKGWPNMGEWRVSKVSRKKAFTEVEVKSPGIEIELKFDTSAGNADTAFSELFFTGSTATFKESAYYRDEVVQRFLPGIFPGKLSVIPTETKLRILEGLQFDESLVRGEEFKGRFYLSISGSDDVVYNTIQVNQAERTSRTVEKMIGSGIKFMPDLLSVKEIQGLKIEYKVFYRDFLNECRSIFMPCTNHSDDIHAYFPFDALLLYKNADITNQELIDRSIILVNGNRVQVSLTQFN